MAAALLPLLPYALKGLNGAINARKNRMNPFQGFISGAAGADESGGGGQADPMSMFASLLKKKPASGPDYLAQPAPVPSLFSSALSAMHSGMSPLQGIQKVQFPTSLY